MAHSRSLLVVLWLLLVVPGALWCADSQPKAQAQPPTNAEWLNGLREMIEGTKGRALEVTLRSGEVVQVASAVMEDRETIKATKEDSSVVMIKLTEVAQMITKGALGK